MQTLQMMPKKEDRFVNCASEDISELLMEDLDSTGDFAFWVVRS